MFDAEGGLEQQRNVGLMVAVPIFLLINALFAYAGGRMMSKLEHKSSEDVLTAHYLGGRSFGPIVSMGTMFASAFSGFAVIGVPNSSYTDGWLTFVWGASSQFITTVYSGVAPRLRKASIVRNHQSPADFVTDMFQSQFLRYTIIISQFISQFVWMTSNVLSIKMAFNGAFNLPTDSPWLAVGVVSLIVVSEWVGGLSAVALTDTVQGTIMVLGSIAVASVIKVHYGGWTALDPETFYRPEFYQTPSRQQQWYWWQNAFLSGSMVFYPIFLQRIYAARDLKSIKAAGWALFMGPWLGMFSGIFIGTMGVQMIGEACQSSSNPAECRNPASPFTTILGILMSIGGFPEAAAIIYYCSALAAIMSTVDSVLISMSQIVTSDILYPLRPKSTPRQIAWMGRAVSVVIAALTLVVALSWKGSIILLFELGLPISMQMVPAFIFGLYSKHRFHPWSLAIPAATMMVATVIMLALWKDMKIHPGVFTFLVNILATFVFEVSRLAWTGKWREMWTAVRAQSKEEEEVTKMMTTADDEEEEDLSSQDPFPDRPQWDKPKVKRFGETSLSPKLLDEMMKGVNEPIRDYSYVMFVILAFTITTPIVAELRPSIIDGVFVELPPVVRGLPAWFFKAMIISFIINFVNIPVIVSIPDEFPYNEEELLRSGIDADAVELEPEEKGGRTGYDEPNQRAIARRQSIREETRRIKKANADAKKAFEEARANHLSATEAATNLTLLVKSPSKRNSVVEKDVDDFDENLVVKVEKEGESV